LATKKKLDEEATRKFREQRNTDYFESRRIKENEMKSGKEVQEFEINHRVGALFIELHIQEDVKR
jgi:hypothetical protein